MSYWFIKWEQYCSYHGGIHYFSLPNGSNIVAITEGSIIFNIDFVLENVLYVLDHLAI